MADYILGLGGKCCDSCFPDDPCESKPKVTVCGTGDGTVGVPGVWGAFSSGQYLTGATWTATDLPVGISINSTTGFLAGTPTADGTYTIPVTATNDCGSATCNFILSVGVFFCSLSLNTAGGDEGYDHTFDVSSDFGSTRDIYVDFESYTVKDRLIIYANGVSVYDSGCIGAHVTPTVSIPGGTTVARVQVIANCEGTSGTAWVLGITCA